MSSLFNGPAYVSLGDPRSNEIPGHRKVAHFIFDGEKSVNKRILRFTGIGGALKYVLIFFGKTDKRPTIIIPLVLYKHVSLRDVIEFTPGAITITWQ